MSKITQELDNIKLNYDKSINIVDGLTFSQKKIIKMIEYYSNSKYLNGQRDELGRDKPFMNILNAICDVENTAKDLDTKDIQITSDDSNHYLESFLLTKDVYVWMKESNFAKSLNDMRDSHTKYGSLLVKKVIGKDKDGAKTLKLEIPEWKNVMTDQVDIVKGAIVETHWMLASQIAKMTEWDEKAKKLVMDKMRNSSSSKRVPVYEIRGEFPVSYFNEVDGKKETNTSETEFSYQLYYIAGSPIESGETQSEEATTVLYWENDTERVYKYLKRKPKSGRDFGVGVYEEGEEAQIGTNDAVIKQARAMEYTSKVLGQSASKKLKGRNLLTESDDGIILEIEDNKPIIPLNLLPSGGLQQYNNLIIQWYSQLEKTTSAYAAQRGDAPPSGTPFRLQATILQQSSSVFKTLQQEFGIFITEIMEDWILPYLSGKITAEHILSYDFSAEELKEIDQKFSTREANNRVIERILNGSLDKLPTQEDYDKYVEEADTFIKGTKSQRFIKIPKDFYKNLKAKVTVNVTGEQRNKAATLESLNNILITYNSNPAMSSDPVASQILAKIIELSGAGISPVSITGAINQKQKQDIATQQQQAQMQQGVAPAGQPTPMPLAAKANVPA